MKCGVIDMCYRVEYSTNAHRFIKKLDKYTKTVIKNWINKNLEGCTNPFQQDKIVILVVEIGHRRDIYKRF